MKERSIINDTPPADAIRIEPTFEVVDLITEEVLFKKPAADVTGLTIIQDAQRRVGAMLTFTEDHIPHEFTIWVAQRLVYSDGDRVLNVYQWT